jgi:hypothetical protein
MVAKQARQFSHATASVSAFKNHENFKGNEWWMMMK